MGFNSIIHNTRTYPFVIISVIFMFCNDFVTMLEIADEDLDNLLAVFNRPLEPLPNISLGSGPADIPDIEDILAFGDREEFSVFIPKHVNLATKLIDIFLGAKDHKELLYLVEFVHNKINPFLLIHAYAIALMHRPDTESIPIPNLVHTFPYQYFNKEVFFPARKEVALKSPSQRKSIDLPLERTGTDQNREHKVAYWREDIALNLHHRHWHLAYPAAGSETIVKKDRRGELFYYVHRQILARYDFERFSNGLERVEKLSNWYAPIIEAYFPKLDNFVAKGIYPSRPKNMILEDIKITTQDIEIDIADLVRIRDRIFEAIDLGYAEDANRDKVILDNITGIDILGNMVESSSISINTPYYGNLHGSGHILIGFIHDPKNHHVESMGVMGDVATAMRDPIFYRWHSFIDNIFLRFKETLPPYTVKQLLYPGVKVTALNIRTEGEKSKNVFHTFWQKTEVNLINGLDFAQETGEIFVGYYHLNHRDFNFEIMVENKDRKIKEGVCRIFMAPKGDESGKPWERLADQRNMFIELDKFNVTLKPGNNIITRKSVDSSVTIPFNESFNLKNKTRDKKDKHVYSGCGWPHHLLIPKGFEQGFSSQLFVMISDYEHDKVPGSKPGRGESYCGVKLSKYPDRQAMGFPFDRLPGSDVKTLQQFLTPNMFVQDCVILHQDKTVS